MKSIEVYSAEEIKYVSKVTNEMLRNSSGIRKISGFPESFYEMSDVQCFRTSSIINSPESNQAVDLLKKAIIDRNSVLDTKIDSLKQDIINFSEDIRNQEKLLASIENCVTLKELVNTILKTMPNGQ